jgi:phenylalanyl-tRNA synthetase beta chain
MLTLGAYGDDMDFFSIKGVVEVILKDLRVSNVEFAPCNTDPSYHPGRCATVSADGKLLGVVGQIHPTVAKNYDVDCELYCAELNMPALFDAQGAEAQYTPLPKYPAVTRDLSFVCDEALTVAKAEQTITAAAGKLLRSVKLFDIYRGANLGEGKKSLAFSLELRADDRTLTDADTEPVITKVLGALASECGAVLR